MNENKIYQQAERIVEMGKRLKEQAQQITALQSSKEELEKDRLDMRKFITALQSSLKEKEEEINEYSRNLKNAVDQNGKQLHGYYLELHAKEIELKEKEKRIEELEKVLTGLVNLKELKDTEGKTEIYLQLQPIAWKRAIEIISKQSDPEWMPLPSPPKK
jgi:chromosome segregation ATPase